MTANTHYLTTAEIDRMRRVGNLKRFVEVMDELSKKEPNMAPLRLIECMDDGSEVLLDTEALVNMREMKKA